MLRLLSETCEGIICTGYFRAPFLQVLRLWALLKCLPTISVVVVLHLRKRVNRWGKKEQSNWISVHISSMIRKTCLWGFSFDCRVIYLHLSALVESLTVLAITQQQRTLLHQLHGCLLGTPNSFAESLTSRSVHFLKERLLSSCNCLLYSCSYGLDKESYWRWQAGSMLYRHSLLQA